MTETDWSEVSGAYSAIRDPRVDTLFAHVLAQLREDPPRRLLDYGGGDGRFAALCASLPIERIVTYDPAPGMTALARERCAALPRVEALDRTDTLPDGHFPLVSSHAVWMSLRTDAMCLALLGEVARLLAPGGVLLASVIHPCFRDGAWSAFRTDFDRNAYRLDGTRYRSRISDGTKEVTVVDTHWSLGAMSRQLAASGFAIELLEELDDRPGGQGRCDGWPWLLLRARKTVRPGMG
jgi:SAM-dependent methyltransferase